MKPGVPSSKRSRSVFLVAGEDEGGVDHVSTLPDAILGEIISLLPTKEGASTQILASRWRHLWRSAPLNLDCGNIGAINFAAVVVNILSSHQGPGRRLRISYLPADEGNEAAVEACLQSLALDNLQELELKFDYLRLRKPVPASVFRFSSTLLVLNIGKCSLSDATVQGLHFPLLKQLGLSYAEISECSLHNMIAGCPVLECMMIYCCHGASCLRINSLCIRRIGVTNALGHALELKELIIVSAPRLETLLVFSDSKDLHVSVLFAPKLETLGCSTKGIVFGSKDTKGLHIDSLATMASTIKCLALRMHALSLDIVIQKIRCFPCLEKLYIQCETSGIKNLWRRKHRDLSRSLDLHLKKLVLRCYRGIKSDVDFVTFFLLNAGLLESITLVVPTIDEEVLAKQRQKLQLEKKASSGAQVQFTTFRRRNLMQIVNVCELAIFDPCDLP